MALSMPVLSLAYCCGIGFVRDEHAGLEAQVALRLEDGGQILRRVDARVNAEAARRQKAVALTKLAAYETSANGRHYYLVCAHELENRH